MPKATRIILSLDLNKSKCDELITQAKLLGRVRQEVWQRFGSINGVGKNHREIRSDWVKNRDFSPLPAKAWKETLRDALDNIKMYEEASTGCLRVIRKDGIVEVHRTIEKTFRKKCGNLILGVDKGYSEAFADSEGNFYGQDFGKVLSGFNDKAKRRGTARNKLFQLLKKKPHKSKNIKKFNLGRKKLNNNISHQKKLICNIAFQSVHKIVDRAQEIPLASLMVLSPIS